MFVDGGKVTLKNLGNGEEVEVQVIFPLPARSPLPVKSVKDGLNELFGLEAG